MQSCLTHCRIDVSCELQMNALVQDISIRTLLTPVASHRHYVGYLDQSHVHQRADGNHFPLLKVTPLTPIRYAGILTSLTNTQSNS